MGFDLMDFANDQLSNWSTWHGLLQHVTWILLANGAAMASGVASSEFVFLATITLAFMHFCADKVFENCKSKGYNLSSLGLSLAAALLFTLNMTDALNVTSDHNIACCIFMWVSVAGHIWNFLCALELW